MTPIGSYSVEAAPDGEAGACSYLLKDGVRTGLLVPGRDLEAQFEGPSGVLLFLTHDIPFEEQLDILLIGPGGGVLDAATVGGGLTTGVFRDVAVTGPDSVTFAFFGGPPWRVTVLAAPRFRLPLFGGEPWGVRRPYGWSRRFVIEPAVKRGSFLRSRSGPSRSD